MNGVEVFKSGLERFNKLQEAFVLEHMKRNNSTRFEALTVWHTYTTMMIQKRLKKLAEAA